MTRQLVEIGSLGTVVTGDTPPKKNPEYYGSAYPFIKPTDMRVGQRYTFAYEECYSEAAYEKYQKKLIPEGATAVVTIGSIGQKLTLTHTACFVNQAVNAVIPNNEEFNSLYVFYLLKHNLNLVKSADTGASSGRENVSKSNFSKLQVLATLDIKEQERIAGILDGYDSLIENNQRRIALLEESARLLYREWFVNLRFPGHGSHPRVDGIPEGWARKSIADMVQINPKTDFERDRIYPFAPMQALSECSMLIEVTEERVISGGAKFQNKDTLLARITPCLENGKTGFVQFLDEDKPVASGSTEFIVMRSESVSPYWVYCTARDEGFRKHAIGSMVGSDGRQRVNPKCFDSYFAFQPPENVLNDFDETVEPMFKEIQLLSRMNQHLREARDALLPKLMSGEIQV